MGILKNKIFYRNINDAIDRLRDEMCAKYKEKKGNRFFSNGITYEIGEGKLDDDGVELEISSKIPQDVLHKKDLNKKYFKDVKSEMVAKPKKPVEVKMENIIRSTSVNEIKERDYVKCIYLYKEKELYTEKDIDKIVKDVQSKKIKLPDIKGITSLPGRAVLYKIEDSMYNAAHKHITDLINANETVIKKYQKQAKTASKK